MDFLTSDWKWAIVFTALIVNAWWWNRCKEKAAKDKPTDHSHSGFQ